MTNSDAVGEIREEMKKIIQIELEKYEGGEGFDYSDIGEDLTKLCNIIRDKTIALTAERIKEKLIEFNSYLEDDKEIVTMSKDDFDKIFAKFGAEKK